MINQQSVSGGGSSGGVTVHNDLTGREVNDTHPISAITGLRAELDALDKVELLKYTSGIQYNVNEVFTDPADDAIVYKVDEAFTANDFDYDIAAGYFHALIPPTMPQVVRVALKPGHKHGSAEEMTVQITLDRPVYKDDYFIQPWRFRHTRSRHKSRSNNMHRPQIRSGFRKQDLTPDGCPLDIKKLNIPQGVTVFTIDIPLVVYYHAFKARCGTAQRHYGEAWRYNTSTKWKFSVCRFGGDLPHKPEKRNGYNDTGALPSAQTLVVARHCGTDAQRDNLAVYFE